MNEKANTTNGVAKKNKSKKSEAEELKVEEATQKHIQEVWGDCDIATLIFEVPVQNRELSVTDYKSLSIEDLAQTGSGVKIVVKNGEQVEVDTKTGKTTKKKKKSDVKKVEPISSEKSSEKELSEKKAVTKKAKSKDKDKETSIKKTKSKSEEPVRKIKSKSEKTVKKTKGATKKTSESDRDTR